MVRRSSRHEPHMPRSSAIHWMGRQHRILLLGSAVAITVLASAACGATVVFGEGETGGEAGADGARECFLGCGKTCTKCVPSPDDGPDRCFTGECTEEGLCVPPDEAPTCP